MAEKVAGPLNRANTPPRFECASTPRLKILQRAFAAAAAFVVWLYVMDRLGLKGGGVAGFVGMFLMVASVALFILTLRRERTVVLDENNLTIRHGTKETVIPWRAFGSTGEELNKQFKLESVMGWQRLNIKLEVYGNKVSVALDRIFGVGLPVLEITAISREMIHKAKGTMG